MSFIEIKSSGPDIPDGVYPVMLTDILGPKTVLAQRGPKAGQEIQLLDWQWVIDTPGQPYHETMVESSTSTATGPKSKIHEYLTALFEGKAPAIGTKLEKGDIVGRSALATVQKNDDGWLKITNLSALPAGYAPGGAGTAAKASEPVAAARDSLTASSDLPF